MPHIKPSNRNFLQRPSMLPGVLLTSVLVLQSACSSPTVKPSSENETAQAQELKTLKAVNESLRTKLDALEARLSSLTDKVDAAQMSLGNLLHSKPAAPTAIAGSHELVNAPSLGTKLTPNPIAPSDPERGFSSEIAVSQYREARLRFEAKHYPEAIVGFSKFLQENADHILAGSAQFYLGECYRLRNEPRLAIQEYQRLLTSYDRSAHVPAALRALMLSEEALKLSEAAQRHRQQLLSYYPQSPAARLLEAKAEPEVTAPAHPATPPTKAPVPTAPSPEMPEAPKESPPAPKT